MHEQPPWRDPAPEDWTARPLSGRLVGAVASGLITAVLIAVWVVQLWP